MQGAGNGAASGRHLGNGIGGHRGRTRAGVQVPIARRGRRLGGFERRQGFRWAVWGVLLALTGGVWVLAFQDLGSRRSALLQARGAALQQLGHFAEVSLRNEEALRAAELRQLRAELRRQDLWRRALDRGPADDGNEENEAHREARDAAGRELASILRRALQSSDGVRVFQLVVADEHGISSRRFDGETTPTTPERTQVSPARNAPDRAEDLWYSDDVRRAVVAAGHRVESSPLIWDAGVEGGSSQAGYRRTIALHDSDELVQGVLVAELDLSAWGRSIAALPGSTGTFELRSADGRSLLDGAGEVDASDRQALEWVSQVGQGPAGSEVFESGGQLVAGGVLAAGDGGASDLIWLARRAAPPSVWAAAGRSPWSLVLFVLILALGITGWGLGLGLRRGTTGASEPVASGASDEETNAREPSETHPPDPPAPAAEGVEKLDRVDEGDGLEEPEALMPPVVAPESFALRAWLSDVRSCLEREAARRGLALEMRCARTLPSEIESDPIGLGALLLLLGRDALDGTAGDRISIDVVGGVEDGLRFELDVGDASLVPPPGLGALATALGAAIELGSDHRVALVLAPTLH